MKARFRIIAAGTALAVLTVMGAFAQKKTNPSTNSANRSTNSANRMTSSSTFATKAAEGGLAEVKLGNLAKDHASSQEVKNFGQKMVDDHSKANEELKGIAAAKNINLPDSMSSADQATYDKLAKLNGTQFDKAYMADMVKDHRKDVNEFKHEAATGTDAELKAFAQKTLPTLQNHLQLAETTYNTVKGEKQQTQK